MKTIIAGSRGITNYPILRHHMKAIPWKITAVVSGGAKGVDTLGEMWAKEKSIPIEILPANWEKYGKSAGYRRNVDMAHIAEALVAFWDGDSKGTKHMIDIAREKGLRVIVIKDGD